MPFSAAFRGDPEVRTPARTLHGFLSMLRDTCPELGSSDDEWRVRFATGELTMTLDELDVAFEAGRIDVDTMVCAPGGFTFARLGAVAGLDEPAPSLAPVDVAFELPDFAPDANPFQKRWNKALLAVPAALAAIGIIAFAASASASSELPHVAAAAELRAAAPISAPVVAPSPPPAAPAPALTEDQKKALSAKDKKAEAHGKAKKAAAAPPKRFAASKTAPFSKGGNKHDPLNGAL